MCAVLGASGAVGSGGERWEPARRKTGVSLALWWSDPPPPPTLSLSFLHSNYPKILGTPTASPCSVGSGLVRGGHGQPTNQTSGRGTSKAEQEDGERTGGDRAALSRGGPKGDGGKFKLRV